MKRLRALAVLVLVLAAGSVSAEELSGVDVAAVPLLETSLNDLTAMSFSPEEGFILSRINGSSDTGSIVMVTVSESLEEPSVKIARVARP